MRATRALQWGLFAAFGLLMVILSFEACARRAQRRAVLAREAGVLRAFVQDWIHAGKPTDDSFGQLAAQYAPRRVFLYTNAVMRNEKLWWPCVAVTNAWFGKGAVLAASEDGTVQLINRPEEPKPKSDLP